MSRRSVQGLQNRALKLRYLDQAKQVVDQLQAENETLKNDPNTVIGQVIPQLRQAISQNKRLSVLCAALIQAQGGRVSVSKEELQGFETKVLNIKWEVPEGVENLEAAETVTFTYEALTQEEANARSAQVVVNEGEQPTVETIEPTTEQVTEPEPVEV